MHILVPCERWFDHSWNLWHFVPISTTRGLRRLWLLVHYVANMAVFSPGLTTSLDDLSVLQCC